MHRGTYTCQLRGTGVRTPRRSWKDLLNLPAPSRSWKALLGLRMGAVGQGFQMGVYKTNKEQTKMRPQGMFQPDCLLLGVGISLCRLELVVSIKRVPSASSFRFEPPIVYTYQCRQRSSASCSSRRRSRRMRPARKLQLVVATSASSMTSSPSSTCPIVLLPTPNLPRCSGLARHS